MQIHLSLKRRAALFFWNSKRMTLIGLAFALASAACVLLLPSSGPLWLGIPLWLWVVASGVFLIFLIGLAID